VLLKRKMKRKMTKSDGWELLYVWRLVLTNTSLCFLVVQALLILTICRVMLLQGSPNNQIIMTPDTVHSFFVGMTFVLAFMVRSSNHTLCSFCFSFGTSVR